MADDNTENIVPIKITEKSVANRREDGTFGPGNIANPLGRPKKGHSITETIKLMMDEKPEIKKALAAKVLQMAAEGDITAIKTIWSYLDGQPLQKTELGGMDGSELKFNILAGLGFVPPATPIDATSTGSDLGGQPQIQGSSVAPEGKEDNNGTV